MQPQRIQEWKLSILSANSLVTSAMHPASAPLSTDDRISMIAAVPAWRSLPFALAAATTPPMSDASPDDDALVRAALANDPDAFAELVRRHKRRVFGTCSRFARDAHQLEDLCQEVFLRAWRKLGR